MRISTTPNATPYSTPPSSHGSRGGAISQPKDEHYIWTSLVPRLIHPTKLAILNALIEAGEPLSIEDLVSCLPAVDGNSKLIKYHAKCMVKVGALEVSSTQNKAGDEALLFYFPIPRTVRATTSEVARVPHRHHKA